jgi:hypothetical protein
LVRSRAEAGPAAYDDEGFGVHFAFFAQTDAEVRLRILEGRRRRVEERRDGLRAGLARTREKPDRHTLQLQEHGLDSVEREVRWLNELIDTERQEQAAAPAPAQNPPAPDPPAHEENAHEENAQEKNASPRKNQKETP